MSVVGVTEDQTDKVASAAMGCTEYVMAHSRAGKFGMVKEAFAMRSAVGDVPKGPGGEIISAAHERLSGGSDSGPNIDATDKDRMLADGRRRVEEVVPVLAELTPEAADQVREWLLGIARKVAEASKDKGGSDKVSEAEAGAIEEIRGLLHG
jgi:hypothetical protein